MFIQGIYIRRCLLCVIVFATFAETFLSTLFHVEKNLILNFTSTTIDVKQRSLLSCAYLCMATTGCCAASFASNSTCRIDISKTCNFILSVSLGDTSILHTSENTDITGKTEAYINTTERDWTTSEGVSPSTLGDSTTTGGYSNTTTNYVFVAIPLPMIQAQAYCNETGGKLLEIKTAEREQLLKDNVLYLASSLFYWLGAYDYNRDGSFKWQSNPAQAMMYTNWNSKLHEPRRIGSNLCIYSYSGWGYSWGSADCTDTNPFFCEKLP